MTATLRNGMGDQTFGSHRRTRAARIREQLRLRGISVAEFARSARCSRQFAWQVLNGTVLASDALLCRFESILDHALSTADASATTGMRLRRARRRAGYTLKETAAMIGYTWVAVERWEQDVCLPKPGVLWHLCRVYGEDPSWIPFVSSRKQSLPLAAAQNE